MIPRRRILSLLPASTALAGCGPADLLNATVPRRGYRLVADIAYGDDPRRRLDVYEPTRPDASRTVVCFFYGGGWNSGGRGDYLFVAQALADSGYLVVVPDYRLWPEVRFPAFVEDGAAAVAWIRANIAIHGGDPARIVLAGHSAGAHTALMLAAGTPYLARAGVDRAAIRGVVGIAGPYDFLPFGTERLRAIFAGAAPADTQPINFVTPGLPPALLLHGDADTTVLPRNTVNLAAAWRAAGNVAETRLYRDVGHIGIVTAFSAAFRERAPTLADTLAFLRRPDGAAPPS